MKREEDFFIPTPVVSSDSLLGKQSSSALQSSTTLPLFSLWAMLRVKRAVVARDNSGLREDWER